MLSGIICMDANRHARLSSRPSHMTALLCYCQCYGPASIQTQYHRCVIVNVIAGLVFTHNIMAVLLASIHTQYHCCDIVNVIAGLVFTHNIIAVFYWLVFTHNISTLLLPNLLHVNVIAWLVFTRNVSTLLLPNFLPS